MSEPKIHLERIINLRPIRPRGGAANESFVKSMKTNEDFAEFTRLLRTALVVEASKRKRMSTLGLDSPL